MTKHKKTVRIVILEYPNVLKSAIFGLEEMFHLANNLCISSGIKTRFNVSILAESEIHSTTKILKNTIIIIPPSISDTVYDSPSQNLVLWLVQNHRSGNILCSVCAGIFILASTQLLNGRTTTTHWSFETLFKKKYEDININVNKILINDGDIITAGGMMSWIDLGLELVSQSAKSSIMQDLGKTLVIDTSPREQQFYKKFKPNFDHTDDEITQIQTFLNLHYSSKIKISQLAKKTFLTERTFLRRFVKSTGLTPLKYIQRLRMQKVCDLLESTSQTFEQISYQVGYEDISACRKVFVKVMGLTPGEFKKRFAIQKKVHE